MTALWILLGLLALIVITAIIVLIRTLTFSGKSETVEGGKLIAVDETWAAKSLSGAVKFATLADQDFKKVDQRPFNNLYAYLQKTFPLVHKKLDLIKELHPARVYRWQGKRKDLKPVVLMGHVDVVPADPECLKTWKHGPFKGDIAGGYVWGRGTLDDKGPVIGILAATELLMKQGFTPERTIYFAFGNDEECSGKYGAERIVEWLKKKKIEPEVVLDEGAAIMEDIFPGVKGALGLIDVAEKGYLTVKLSVEGVGGHSATPDKQTAISILARAIARLEDHRMPADLTIIKGLFRQIGKAVPFAYRLIFANTWLLGGIACKILGKGGMTNAAIRTTIASTMIHGGIKDNILPTKVEAAVNARLLPGDSIEKVVKFIEKSIADEQVKVEPMMSYAFEPSPVSPSDNVGFKILKNAVRQGYGNIPVAPFLVIGATDARYYAGLCWNVYRFAPYLMDKESLKSVHGTNERISVKVLGKMIQVYAQVIQGWGTMGSGES